MEAPDASALGGAYLEATDSASVKDLDSSLTYCIMTKMLPIKCSVHYS